MDMGRWITQRERPPLRTLTRVRQGRAQNDREKSARTSSLRNAIYEGVVAAAVDARVSEPSVASDLMAHVGSGGVTTVVPRS